MSKPTQEQALEALASLQKVRNWNEGKGDGKLCYDFLFGTDKRDTPQNRAYIDTVEHALRAYIQSGPALPVDVEAWSGDDIFIELDFEDLIRSYHHFKTDPFLDGLIGVVRERFKRIDRLLPRINQKDTVIAAIQSALSVIKPFPSEDTERYREELNAQQELEGALSLLNSQDHLRQPLPVIEGLDLKAIAHFETELEKAKEAGGHYVLPLFGVQQLWRACKAARAYAERSKGGV